MEQTYGHKVDRQLAVLTDAVLQSLERTSSEKLGEGQPIVDFNIIQDLEEKVHFTCLRKLFEQTNAGGEISRNTRGFKISIPSMILYLESSRVSAYLTSCICLFEKLP